MYHRDHLVRMMEQFSLSLGKVIFHRRNQRFHEALQLLAQAMKQLLGLNSKLVQALSAKDLLGLLSTQGHVDVGKGLLLSDMLREEGDVLAESGDDTEAIAHYVKSMELLVEMYKLHETHDFKADVAERLEKLLVSLWPQHVPVPAMELLMFYYADTGQLSKAEDALFFVLDEQPDNMGAVVQGLEMLGRWLKLEADELAGGGLTREEITDSIAELLKMKQNAV
ncbi:DUF6483 family protein [Paenibacillus xerothermodurans]|uniref:Tetratricopeptide repeat protein n=1 Tax=Paenibacillus xerothermodurans TaxID=1977292 RepID=A0A2W1NML9_PAEXE|nr:DUF6483 family protein [Paenibacillus xerothermodurans]PZE20213.1 hypothetical protein CBW46_013760 [Paenibacillus xerothermodurans]